MKLWDTYDGEPFLENGPGLLLINKRRKTKMARKRRTMPKRGAGGRFVKRSSSAAPRRRRRTPRRRTYNAVSRHIRRYPKRRGRRVVRLHRGQVALVNRHKRRHYRRNAPMFAGIGLNMETFKTVGLTAGGFLGTPFVEGFIVNYLPTSISGNRFARYAIRIGAAVGLGFLAGKALGKDAGKKVAVGGLAYVGVGILRDFMPTLATGTGAYLRGAGSQPLLGAYQRTSMGAGSYMTAIAPSRNNPANRY